VNTVRSNIGLHHQVAKVYIIRLQRFTPSGCKNKGIRKFEFVARTQFLCKASRGRNFGVYIVNLKPLILISNVGTFKFEDQRLIPQLNVSLQGMTATGKRIKMLDPEDRNAKVPNSAARFISTKRHVFGTVYKKLEK